MDYSKLSKMEPPEDRTPEKDSWWTRLHWGWKLVIVGIIGRLIFAVIRIFIG